ncbi:MULTISPECIES: ABC transporter permease subunit [unclassified Mesorhizobium]|uniref:ABC transporter permease n=1 Tax=unclassified Mesorhizobium TaxID=325217 RepID=UPI00109335F5|nr:MULTISPECIES: ABC transporter permease subunit [unclassified Mesorhizobium]TGQ40535.1 ABC transporter permease subunit [Mesorhizobium sp. M4B.F.Ca.ET.214.01.1.1]TGQ60592.1 ABC transporter permease subunit [Mesorhizobium sp. M4B.F.Ca.ET.211.01.1.1]TGU36460.1 ABC transporter permease subunit [Mesorhizobium sp. M4B.F.Ca.ET.150.01.1.1]TIX17038.1 MAG: ABC transporter permease subunit [Mesorhizobium sp.]
MILLAVYVVVFFASYYTVKTFGRRSEGVGLNAVKTVTFGDASAVISDRRASFISVLTLYLLWAAFTGSSTIPGFLRVPAPFVGDTSFTYTAGAASTKPENVQVNVHVAKANELGGNFPEPQHAQDQKSVSLTVQVARTAIVPLVGGESEKGELSVTNVNGEPVSPGKSVLVSDGSVTLTSKGSLIFAPYRGWQMDPIWLPPPEAVVARTFEIARDGFRNSTLLEHLGISLFRVMAGFILGSVVGIPLGYAMGLSNWCRGWFDPIVEFMRPVPPLALIPLVIIWAGIGELSKVILLFLAALWIMAIAARSGVSGTRLSKIHAAYSLGASKQQVLMYVIVPNSLPDLFTGARVAMGVCWGTVVAAELVAAERGVGMMIMVASKFQSTDIVIMGVIMIGIIGFCIDLIMRWAEQILVPWKGRG